MSKEKEEQTMFTVDVQHTIEVEYLYINESYDRNTPSAPLGCSPNCDGNSDYEQCIFFAGNRQETTVGSYLRNSKCLKATGHENVFKVE